MKLHCITATAVVCDCLATSALADGHSIINQVNPLDVTNRFYPHPARLYWSSEPLHPLGEHPAVLVKRAAAQTSGSATAHVPFHPALRPVSDNRTGSHTRPIDISPLVPRVI